METKCIDLRGQVCPATLLKALREINENKNDIKSKKLILVFLSNNRDSTVTLPETAENMGYSSNVIKEQDYYRIEISAASY